MKETLNLSRRRLLSCTAIASTATLLPSVASASGSDLQKQLNRLVNQQRSEGRISHHERTAWTVFDFQTRDKLVSINATRYMQAASMVKVFVALAYFFLNEQAPHKYPYTGYERHLMERMLVKSSNHATNTLMEMCKGPANVQRLCQLATKHHFQRLHIVEYIPDGGRTYRNRVSADDYNRFLSKLWHDELPHAGEIKRIMSIKNHDRITTEIMPLNTRVYDKTGSTRTLSCDARSFRISLPIYAKTLSNTEFNWLAKRIEAFLVPSFWHFSERSVWPFVNSTKGQKPHCRMTVYLSHKKIPQAKLTAGFLSNNGADDKNRTYDLLITSQLLYQLSYVGVGGQR